MSTILQITATVNGCHSDPSLRLPITIGTLPFTAGVRNDYQPVPLATYPVDSTFNPLYPPALPSSVTIPMPMPTAPEIGSEALGLYSDCMCLIFMEY